MLQSRESSQLTLAASAETQGHMLELTTGYRSGDPGTPAPGEPREGFDPSLPMRQRVATKAAKLGISPDTLWYRLIGIPHVNSISPAAAR